MERVTKKAFSRTLAALLAVIMVFAPLSASIGELGILSAWASGDDGGDTLHSNTAYSNGKYAVIYDKIAIVGSGFSPFTSINGDIGTALGVDASKVVSYTTLDEAKSNCGAGSLVVYACGTELISATTLLSQPEEFAVTLKGEVDSLKANGADVLLVTPGPIVEYGEGMYYSTHSHWSPQQIAGGSNITNYLSRLVDVIVGVANEKQVGILSLYSKAKLADEDAYLEGTADGIYPAASGYAYIVKWIAEYISEHYVVSAQAFETATVSRGDVVIDFGAIYNDIDAVTIEIPDGNDVPNTLCVHTTKDVEDQWFEAVASVKTDNHASGVYSASFMFEASTARYVRVSCIDGTLPANIIVKVHKTKLLCPVLTYPTTVKEVTTKQAFNIEWSAVAGADSYDVVITEVGGEVVKKFTTSDDTQTVPRGVFLDGKSYNISITAIRSGYIDAAVHSSTGSFGPFVASDNAPLALSSESIYENVSESKLITIGEQTNVAFGKSYTIEGVAGDGKLTDGIVQIEANPIGATQIINITSFDSDDNGIVELILNLGDNAIDVSAVYFDTAFLAAFNTGNSKPDSVKVQYSTDGSTFEGFERSMINNTSVRTLSLGVGSVGMERYIENIGATNAKAVKLIFDLTEATEQNYLSLDEICVIGRPTGSVLAIARDGQTVLNRSLSGVNSFNGTYTSGSWVTHSAFTAVAPLNNAVPVELIVDLNTDASMNALSQGNHLVTGLDIGFAVDTNAICPSSIVVSVQKDGEDIWTEVGGKLYIDYGTGVAKYLDETIPFTSVDNSDIYAARIKVTLYGNIGNSGYPTDITSGTWGNWFALSHLKVRGGQYIGTVEPDGATAAYHANYLQNTDLFGRDNFGDVNATDIWNTISWKSAGYKTANSGYLESTGNITIGKVYWASEHSASSPANVTVPTTIKANATISSIEVDSSNSLDHGNNTANISVLFDGDTVTTGYPTAAQQAATYRGQGSGTGVFKITLNQIYSVTKLVVYAWESYAGIGNFAISTSVDGTTWQSNSLGTISGTPGTSGTGSYASTTYKGAITIPLASAAEAKYIKFTFKSGAWGSGLNEIQVQGTVADTTPPDISDIQVTEVTASGYRVTCIVSDNSGVASVKFPTWTVANDQDDIIWHEGESLGNNKWTYYVQVSQHGNESGQYITHIYAFDTKNNTSCANLDTITVPNSANTMVNFAPGSTYSYAGIRPGYSIFTEGPGTNNVFPFDYEVPDYSATYSSSSGGTGVRDVGDGYKKGKLNDDIFASVSNGRAPYHWVGLNFATSGTANSGEINITFDLGAERSLDSIYFYNVRKGNGEGAASANVTFSFSTDGSNFSNSKAATVAQDGTLPDSLTITTSYNRYKYSTSGIGGTYRYVKINVKNPNGQIVNLGNIFYIDEVVINGYVSSETGPDLTVKNWALHDNGGTYKNIAGNVLSTTNNTETYVSGNDWNSYHSGKLNNGTIATVTPATNNTTDFIEISRESSLKTVAFVYKLSTKVDVTKVNVYAATREGSSNRTIPDRVDVYVSETEEQAVLYSDEYRFGSVLQANATVYSSSSYTKQFSTNGTATGKYVTVVLAMNSSTASILPITEIEIFGVKSTNLDAPVITSHHSEQEIGLSTELYWDSVLVDDNGVVYYTVTSTNEQGEVKEIAAGLTACSLTFGNDAFTLGEGYYTITVYADAAGWTQSSYSITVYYSPKYIIRFFATGNGQLKSSGNTSSYVQFAFPVGSTWADESVKAAVYSVVAMPYYDASGNINYFSSWSNADGEEIHIPDSGEITANQRFYAKYSLTDTVGTMTNRQMTDGMIYDGRGTKEDFTFDFINEGEAYDYMIIDLGAIYYSLTDFNVSFYKVGAVLPFQITFEVSSKLQVPTIAQGAAFADEDWQYVSVVTSDKMVEHNENRYTFSADASAVNINEGAHGRYVKVTFWYTTDCEGVDVDEVMISGSDEHVRTNVAEGKTSNDEVLTDGAETNSYTGSEFTVNLGEVKAGIYSFQLVGATGDATISISAGGENANDFYVVETISSNTGIYKLSDKVSAKLVRINFDSPQTVSEYCVYADAGRENYYLETGITKDIVLASGTVNLDNVVSCGADAFITGEGATVNMGGGANTMTPGANNLTDMTDMGYANGTIILLNNDKRLVYAVRSAKKGSTNLVNFSITVDWTPVLGSTNLSVAIGTKTYKFEFNGDVDKGFVTLQGETPYTYTAYRFNSYWTVEFSVRYDAVTSSNVPSDIGYNITAYEGATAQITTGNRTYTTDGTTIDENGNAWTYTDQYSTWSTISATSDNKVIATIDLRETYYGLNTFAITTLESGEYKAPVSVLFQVSDNNSTWKNVGYTEKNSLGDYRYYLDYQMGEAYAYNFSTNFEGISARYVRAVLTTEDGASTAIQEFWVNALKEPVKVSGGNSAVAEFDYKMLWDEDNLYIAFQYEEDEVPFYTANHQYYETFNLIRDSGFYSTNGTFDSAEAHKSSIGGWISEINQYPNAFSISNLDFNDDTGYFQLDHIITKLNDENTETSGYYQGYSTQRENSFKIYKIGGITWNQGDNVTAGEFQYGSAVEATSIACSTIATETNAGGKTTIAASSQLNGYILVSDGYAISQTIGGYSLTAKPITVEGNTIPANQITDDLVWYFENVADVAGTVDKIITMADGTSVTKNVDIMPASAKALGQYNIYSLYREAPVSEHIDKYFLDNDTGMCYTPYYFTRAYQGEIWENVYTFPRHSNDTNIRIVNTEGNRAHTPTDTNINFEYDANTGMWDIFLRGQGTLAYSAYYDNIDGASSMRMFLSAANMNDTARYDYGNYDIVIDAYVIDRNELFLEDGTVLPLDSTLPAEYSAANHASDLNTAWNGYKNVELKATAIGMTPETNNYAVNFNNYKAKARFSQSENGQRLLTVEVAIPFSELGFSIQKSGSGADATVTKWGNFYTKTGIEQPLGKRTLMQFDSSYAYTINHTTGSMSDIDEFYYYVDASEFGYVLQFAPEGKGYQDLSYNKGDGYATFSSVRGEVLNTTNGTEIEYDPSTFEISKIHSTRTNVANMTVVNRLAETDAFKYVEKDGMYYFTSQLEQELTFNQGGTIATEMMIPAGGAYFSFDWKVSSETSDNLSFWLEQTDTWNADYKDWINTYNCGLPYKYRNASGTSSQKAWVGVLDYYNSNLFTLYSEARLSCDEWIVNNVELKNDPCIAVISGYRDNTRNPEHYMLASWKECKRSNTTGAVTVNIDDVVAFSPITANTNGSFKHVWDWNNVTVWIPNETDNAISYTMTWMYWKNGTSKDSYAATDGRGTDDAQITNFHLSTTDELGYWKTSENWDTLRLDATIADPSDTLLGIKDLAKAIVGEDGVVPAISATTNNPGTDTLSIQSNKFGTTDFFTLSYAAIAMEETVGTTTQTTSYYQTKNKINISASNVPAAEIELYKNNAIVFTQEYKEVITASSNLVDWTIIELKYNSLYNTWNLTRMIEEGVDKSKFNIHADNNTIIIAVNYTYPDVISDSYGETTEAIFFGYQNREVLKMLVPELRYSMNENNTKINETVASKNKLEVTQFITSNIFIRENYNIAVGKKYSLRNNPTYRQSSYPYMEDWFKENNTEDALAAFMAVYSETPLYYVNQNGEIEGMDNTDGDYSKAFQYVYRSYNDSGELGLHNKPMRFDTNQYSNVLYVPAGVGQLTDGIKMSVYSDTYLVEALEDYAIGYFVTDTMGTPDADTVESINPDDRVYSYTQTVDAKHDCYEVYEDVHTREENVIIDLGTVEYGLSAFNIRFLGGGENGVTFPTSVEFSISTDGLSYAYIGSVALDDTGYNSTVFDDAYASIVFTGNTDTVYGNTVADYMFNLQTVGVTARYIKATIMNHSAQNSKTFISEFQVTQNAIYPDEHPVTTPSTWIDASADATYMYHQTLDMWNNSLEKPYSFDIAPTTAGYLFAADEGYPDIAGHSVPGAMVAGQLTDGIGGAALHAVKTGLLAEPTIAEMKEASVGWMKAYAPEVSLTFDLGSLKEVGFISVYALQSKDSIDKITQPFNVTAYVTDDVNGDWLYVATVNAKDNDASEVTIKGMDVVLDTDTYTVYKYTLAFARDGELAQQVSQKRFVKIVAETDGGEDGWICLTEVEVYEGHPCYPVYDLTDSKYKKVALGLTEEQIANQDSEVRATFFRGYYDSALYESELPAYTANAQGGSYDVTKVFNDVAAEDYTVNYVFGNVEQRAINGRGVPYFYEGDQLLLRVTTDNFNAEGYDYRGDWVSSYKLLAESKIYYTSVGENSTYTTRLFTTTSVPTPMTRCNVLARDRYTCELPSNYNWENSYYYLPIYLMNSLDYLKDYGYHNRTDTENYINMPANKVELSGNLVWDTNTESDYNEYANDKNGISLNLAPLGAKTNTANVTYNNVERKPNTTLRFGSIWYIDDTAYYNTHTHMKRYGTLLMTTGNLGKYFTDAFASTSRYKSVFDDYALSLTKLDDPQEVSGVTQVTGIDEVVKLTNVTEVLKLTNVAETDAANAKFILTVEGEVKYYTCTEDITIDTETGIGHVWQNGDNYWYCENTTIGKYKFTTDEDGSIRYWYCTEDVSYVNFINEDGYWYSMNSTVDGTIVYSTVLANGETVYYYNEGETALSFKSITRDSTGKALYWTYDQDYPSWTFTTVEGSITKYYYSSNYTGVAGGYVLKDGVYYASSSNTVYNDVMQVDQDSNEYWGAKSKYVFDMLVSVSTIVGTDTNNETKVLEALDIFLECINNYSDGPQAEDSRYEDFGGIAIHSKADKYYYFSNISTNLVPEEYDSEDIASNPLYDIDSNKNKLNMTELLGVYNYCQRFLEFDAIIAGIPESQKNNKIVAVPYIIYANNYEFLEFGEHLGGDGDEYVEDTWKEIFNQYYGGELAANNRRYYVYGGGIARSINDVLASQSKQDQFD